MARESIARFARETIRHDTISLRSRVTYDPRAPRPSTPIMIGKHVVMRSPLLGSLHTLYRVMDGRDIVLTSISIPSEHDCDCALAAHAARRSAAEATSDAAIAKAKKRAKHTTEEVPA
jgi:hypothetical protein